MACSLVVVPAPAQARSITVTDEARDTIDPGLDITSVQFRNRDRVIQAAFTFRRDRRGEVIVLAKTRNGPAVKIIIQHPREGDDKAFVINGRGKKVPCRLTHVWDRSAASVTLRMSSKCLDDGNYGAVRFWALIEGYRSKSSDVDYAPEDSEGHLKTTRWIARG